MASLGLSAKQEKDDRLQKIKQEVVEMVSKRLLYMKSKVLLLFWANSYSSCWDWFEVGESIDILTINEGRQFSHDMYFSCSECVFVLSLQHPQMLKY